MTRVTRTARKDPPQSVIAAGYAMILAYEGFYAYGSDEYSMATVINTVREAIEEVRTATWLVARTENRECGNEDAHGLFYNETGLAMVYLNEAAAGQFEFVHMRGDRGTANHFAVAAAREKIRAAHYELFRMIERYGYRAPTQSELDALGSTGGR